MDILFFLLYTTLFGLGLVLTALLLRVMIPRLTERAAQPIYEGGPRWHAGKSGTPTMGGVAFILAISVACSIFGLSAWLAGEMRLVISIALICLFSLLNGLVGLIDDMKKLRRKQNAGLRPIEKLLLQGAIAAVFLLMRQILFDDGTEIVFSFGSLELGIFYYPLAFLLILGVVNCANLTDGIDGLAAGVAFAIGVALFYISAIGVPDVATVAVALMGATVGFLFFNINPARIFMGDTGSLYLGALAVSSCFALGNPALMLPVGSVYVVEGASVILQVVIFKLTGKRLFKMAPLHHHLERCGMSENKICVIAILLTLATSLVAFLAYAR